MTKDEILVIRINTSFISPETIEELKKSIIEQKETGVVVLPYFAEAIIAPKDVEIKIEEDKEGCWLAHKDGKWVYAKCSECETIHDIKTNYCPNCGAKMKRWKGWEE